mmetsp:Transcript_29297/g.39811  ORF Transcript_29297/g.39811 Transcript_29297/m.39811 type:complete len:236 (-) Transcript_29297:1579-2286(-)
MVERVLRNVCHAKMRVLPHLAYLRLMIPDKAFHQSRLPGTIWSNACHTRCQTSLDRHVYQDVLCRARVCEGNTCALCDGLRCRLHAFKEPGIRKVPYEPLRRLQLEVRLRLRLHGYEVGQVSRVCHKFASLVVHDVGTHVVQELRVVGHNHAGHVRERVQVIHQLLHFSCVHVVGRLVEHHDVRVVKHGPRQRKLHLPPARQRHHRLVLALLIEPHFSERRVNFFLSVLRLDHWL